MRPYRISEVVKKDYEQTRRNTERDNTRHNVIGVRIEPAPLDGIRRLASERPARGQTSRPSLSHSLPRKDPNCTKGSRRASILIHKQQIGNAIRANINHHFIWKISSLKPMVPN
ncbi:hypothetical protein ElyMa_006588800 [Elysia marginata]|uniref:Uncharacterized protein n=1 Tax=Elysia marginata TaxID=1093978 RepID=A0AAV4IFC6_9GAST|nr:hypothetical protein ElyMa_006588800 [Elysia marginata]